MSKYETDSGLERRVSIALEQEPPALHRKRRASAKELLGGRTTITFQSGEPRFLASAPSSAPAPAPAVEPDIERVVSGGGKASA